MCGICGVVELEPGAPVDGRALAGMRETLAHRGPNDSGLVIAGPAGLAMRRLAIIDIEGGRQPLTNEDGTLLLVCNGEIYNHRDLRSELISHGHRFATASDCEVAIHAYEQWGDGFPERLNGMFALALWDGPRRLLHLARDRVGIKPLYYTLLDSTPGRSGPGRLLFASEPKAILAWPGFPRRLDPVSFDQYLTLEYVPAPRSIYQGIARVRPGHRLTLELDTGKMRETPYWSLDLSPAPLAEPIDALAGRLWETFRSAVEMELMSDVPLGVFLSGGIDSSAVAAAMCELRPGAVHSFSIGFEDASFDESLHARSVARALGTRHSERRLSTDRLRELVPQVTELLDEPLADPSVLPTHLLSRFAREHVTVALGGDGADELFAGYPMLQAHRLAGLYRRLPRFLRRSFIEPLVHRLPVSHDNRSLEYRAKRILLGLERPVAERHQLWRSAWTPEGKQSLLTDAIAAACRSSDPLALGEHLGPTTGYDDLSRVLYLDMKTYLEGDILVKLDRASMAASLEARVPMLNRVMLDFATRLPIDLKLRGLTGKYLLRRALRGKLPEAVLERPKQGFNVPVGRWLRSDLKGLLLDALAEPRLRRQGLFQPAVVQRLIAEHMDGRVDHRKPLWTLLVFQLWHERYLERAP